MVVVMTLMVKKIIMMITATLLMIIVMIVSFDNGGCAPLGEHTLLCSCAAGRLWEMFKCTINDCINQHGSLTLS